jgi:1-deoxyxylulose-5-phosphate synthase
MRTLRIPGTDLEVSAVCYGVASFGTAVRGQGADLLYDTFRQAGGNFFDTAHCYGFWAPGGLGASERWLGEAVRRRGEADKVVIATKGAHPAVEPDYPRPERYLSPEVIASDLTESLQRMGLPRVDLYILHRDDARVPVGEIIDCLNAEVARGRIRYLGASNWSVARIAQANEYAASRGVRGLAVSQPQWSLAHTNSEPPTSDPAMRYLMPADAAWHAKSQVAVMAYSSTARGYFATGGASAKESFDNPTSRERLERSGQLAARRGCSVNQVALAYLMHQAFPAVPIIGTTKLDHLRDALAAPDVMLSAEEARWLREG